MIIAQTGQRIYSMKLEYQLRAVHTWREHEHTEELNIKDAHAKPQRLPTVRARLEYKRAARCRTRPWQATRQIAAGPGAAGRCGRSLSLRLAARREQDPLLLGGPLADRREDIGEIPRCSSGFRRLLARRARALCALRRSLDHGGHCLLGGRLGTRVIQVQFIWQPCNQGPDARLEPGKPR